MFSNWICRGVVDVKVSYYQSGEHSGWEGKQGRNCPFCGCRAPDTITVDYMKSLGLHAK